MAATIPLHNCNVHLLRPLSSTSLCQYRRSTPSNPPPLSILTVPGVRSITVHYGTQESERCCRLFLGYHRSQIVRLKETGYAHQSKNIDSTALQIFKSLGAVWRCCWAGLTSVKVVLLGDDLPPVLGALSRQLLGLIQPADGQGLDVLLEGLIAHLFQGFLHGAEEGLHAALQVVRCLLWLDDEAQALHAIGPPGSTEHNIAWKEGWGGGWWREQEKKESPCTSWRGLLTPNNWLSFSTSYHPYRHCLLTFELNSISLLFHCTSDSYQAFLQIQFVAFPLLVLQTFDTNVAFCFILNHLHKVKPHFCLALINDYYFFYRSYRSIFSELQIFWSLLSSVYSPLSVLVSNLLPSNLLL